MKKESAASGVHTLSVGDATTAVENAKTLSTMQFKPLFSEVYDMCRHDIVAFARIFFDVELHPGQVRWVETCPWADERYLSSGNRYGKSFAGAIKGLHHCLFQTRLPKYAELTHRYIAVNLSLTLDMASIVWDQAFSLALQSKLYKEFVLEDKCRRTPFPTMIIGKNTRNNPFRSEYWARSSTKKAKYLLGKDFDYVNYDEAARDPDGLMVKDDVLLMRLADRSGRIDYTSTGNFRNWYFREFLQAQEIYKTAPHNAFVYAQTGSSYENPNIDHEKLKRNESQMNDQYVIQNIYGGFADSISIFPAASLEECYRGQDYSLPVPPVSKGAYVMGVDLGRKQDATVILVTRIDSTPAQLVYAKEMGGSGVTWDDIYMTIASVNERYNQAFTLLDSTSSAGDIHMNVLENNFNVQRVDGYNFGGNKSQKRDLIAVGQRAIQGKWLVFPYIERMYDELVFYSYEDKGMSTDWVMAFCLMAMAMQRQTWVGLESDDHVWVADSTNEVPGGILVPGGSVDRLMSNHYAV